MRLINKGLQLDNKLKSVGELGARYGFAVTEIAALVVAAGHALRGHEEMLSTLNRCIESHLIQHDVHPDLLGEVVAALGGHLAPRVTVH